MFKFITPTNEINTYMKKHLFYPALWGVLTLSLLSSCRTEDGAITQKQVEDKRFAVLISKSGKPVNYADGFAFLMKKYDNVHGTNISGANNTKANLNASISPLFQKNSGSYVEFKVRSFVITEENGEKWVVFPRVENNQIIGLIICTLKEKETLIAFDEIKSDSDYYKQLLPLFQEAFNRYNRRKASLLLNASIKPMAIGGEGAEPGGGGVDCGNDVQQCGYIEEVVIPGKPKEPKEPPTQPIGVSSCDSISDCPPPNYDGSGGGGGGSGSADYETSVSPNIRMKLSHQKMYPRFTAMVKNLENFVKNNPIVLKALVKNTGLTEAKVLEGLKWGVGPTVDFDDFNANKYGEYSNFSKRLIINRLYVNELEATSLASTQKTVSFLLAITVLHEYTHYGDMLADGYEGDYEMGWGFEQDILGGARLFVNRSNAGFYVKMFKF